MNPYKLDTNFNFKINKLDTTTAEWCLRREFDAYKRYTQNGYFEKINSALRCGITTDQFVNDDILAIDKLFLTMPNKLRTKSPMTVYRGTVLTQELKDIINGKTQSNIYTEKAFVSTTKSKQVAELFATKEDGIIMKINIPRGSSIIDDENLPSYASSKMGSEKEVLLPCNAQFRILSYDPLSRIVEAEYIGQKQPLEIPRIMEIKYSGRDILSNLNKEFILKDIKIKEEHKNKIY